MNNPLRRLKTRLLKAIIIVLGRVPGEHRYQRAQPTPTRDMLMLDPEPHYQFKFTTSVARDAMRLRELGFYQTSRKYGMLSKLPDGMSGIGALKAAVRAGKLQGNDEQWAENMGEWHAGDFYLRVCAPRKDKLELWPDHMDVFEEFRAQGGGTFSTNPQVVRDSTETVLKWQILDAVKRWKQDGPKEFVARTEIGDELWSLQDKLEQLTKGENHERGSEREPAVDCEVHPQVRH